jgi:hypothetical protein
MQCTSVILSSVAFLVLQYWFSILSQKAAFSEKNILNIQYNTYFDVLYNFDRSVSHYKENSARCCHKYTKFLCAVPVMCSTCYVQYLLCTVPVMYSTRYVQYPLCTVPVMYSTYYVQYLLCAVRVMCKTCYVQYLSCAVPVMCSTRYVQYQLCTVPVMYSTSYV